MRRMLIQICRDTENKRINENENDASQRSSVSPEAGSFSFLFFLAMCIQESERCLWTCFVLVIAVFAAINRPYFVTVTTNATVTGFEYKLCYRLDDLRKKWEYPVVEVESGKTQILPPDRSENSRYFRRTLDRAEYYVWLEPFLRWQLDKADFLRLQLGQKARIHEDGFGTVTRVEFESTKHD